MSKFASYRNTSVYIPNTAYINISKEVAAYNVSKGLLFPIQNTPCPPNAMCAQVVRYSYVNPNNCACVTQPCPQCAAQMTEYVPSDAKIYSVIPDCAANERCRETLYATKGKANPVLEIPKETTTTDNTNIGTTLTKKFDNIALGMLAATWGINGYLAYKFWAKSMMWKVGIVAVTAANTYSTLKYLKKRKENTDQNTVPTTSDKSITSEKQ